MSNKERGEITFTAEEKEYILRYDFNDLVIAEDLFQKPIQELLRMISEQKFGLGDLRKMFYAGLLGKRKDGSNLNDLQFESSDLDSKLDVVGHIIKSLGGFAPVSDLIQEALVLAFPLTNGDGKKKKKSLKSGTGKS